jgi:hypothetical protein
MTLTTLPSSRTAAISRPDGARDFDFLLGQWKIHNRRLRKSGNGVAVWEEFETTQEVRPILNGFGNEDGTSFRLFNPKTNRWSIFWIDRWRGVLGPAVGRFTADAGLFEMSHAFDDERPGVRFTWLRASDAPRWEQAMSDDDGRTWETNWVMDFTRIRRVHIRVIA